jgi:hypothetical protein
MSSASPGCSRVGQVMWGRTKRNLIAVVSICSLALMLGASPASARKARAKTAAAAADPCTTVGGCTQTAAPNCLQSEYTFETGSTTSLNCTANDVKIAFASNPRDAKGNPILTCVQGDTLSFIADFTVVTTATSRQNIGLYMNTKDEPGGALTGTTCADNIISPRHDPGANGVSTCSNTVGNTQCLGTSSYEENDPQVNSRGTPTPDNCGDITTDDNNQVVTVEVDDVKCEPAPGCTGNNCPLVLPNCTSWQQPGGTIECESTPPHTGWPYVTAAVPGSPSKCNCNSTFTVPITVQTGNITVTKTANPTSITGTDGGTSTYTVTVTNNFNTGSVTIDQICDNKYGNIATASGFAGAACPAGSLCSSPNNVAGTTCATNISCTPALPLPATLQSPGDSITCTFVGAVPESSTVTDTVTANGVTQNGTAVSGTASATVTTGDAPASATFIKTLGSANPTSGCATVIYDVEVDNTSGLTTDEAETLTALSDNVYGDITTVHGSANTNGSVVSTTCAVTQSIAVGGKYNCSFDGVMCGALGAVTNPTACSAGLEVTDILSGTLTGDETETVSTTAGSRTVEVCFSASSN